MAGNVIYKIHSGGSLKSASVAPSAPTNFTATKSSNGVVLKWTDPPATVYDDGDLVCQWAYSVVFRRTDRYPTSATDGTKIVQSSIRNQYQSSGYTNTTATSKGTTYYYSVFAVSTEGLVSSPARASVTIPASKVMTVIIDQSDSNPATCCSYADDAIGMPSGKTTSATSEWQQFFGYRPCLFKDGQVVGYLNPNDYTKFEDGTEADITSGNSGDVMIEFPRRGLNISKSGSQIRISMTDNPDNPSFEYKAHTRGTARKDFFYIGAYESSIKEDRYGGIPESLSGKKANRETSLFDWRIYTYDKGDGYELVTFYQWIYLQAMFILQFKNINSQSLGAGCKASVSFTNGALNTSGMVAVNQSTSAVKLFGIENIFKENYYQLIDGITCIVSDPYCQFWIAPNNTGFNSVQTGGYEQLILWNGYEIAEFTTNTKGYISSVSGETESGFFPTAINGSLTTYYGDEVYLYPHDTVYTRPDIAVAVGGSKSDDYACGLFSILCEPHAEEVSSIVGARMSYY